MASSALAELEDVISKGSVERRVEALNHLTELFVSGAVPASDDQSNRLDILFLRLCTEIEVATRRALAVRLARLPHAPPKIVRMLANDDEIEVATPILSQSVRLDENAIIEIITTKSQQYLMAVSTRASLTPAVTDVLVERGDQAVVRSTAGNEGARFSEAGYEILVARAEGDDDLATCVGLRSDIPRYLFLEIVKKASDAVRDTLEEKLPHLSQDIQRAITVATARVCASSAHGSRDYNAAEQRMKVLHDAGRLTAVEIERLASAGHIEDTIAALATLGKLPTEIVERALMLERIELLLIIARAIGLTWSATKFVVLLRGGSQGLSSAAFEQYLNTFERLKTSTAQQALRFYILRGTKESQSALRSLTN